MSSFTSHRTHDSSADPRPPFGITHIRAQHTPNPFLFGKINLHSLVPPPCNTCSRPSTLFTVHPANPNNNGGRPYYKCMACPWGYQFITWADAKGFSPDNIKCDCGFGSRVDHVGVSHGVGKRGRRFWTCVTGRCGFFSWGGEDMIKVEEEEEEEEYDGGSGSEDGEEVEVKEEEEDDGQVD